MLKIICTLILAVSSLQANAGTGKKSPNEEVVYSIEVIKSGNKLDVVKVTRQDIASLAGNLHEMWFRGLGPVEISADQWAEIFANAKPTALCKSFLQLKHLSYMNEKTDVAPAFVDFVNRQLLGASRALQVNKIECKWEVLATKGA